MGREFGFIVTLTVLVVALLGAAFVLDYYFVSEPEVTQDNLTRYSGYEEMMASFSKARSSDYGYYRGGILDMVTMPMMATAEAGTAGGAKSADGGTDYSATNIQVEGVDEADIIKTDGKYAYAIAGGKLYIVNVFPAEETAIASKIEFEEENFSPVELFVSGDKLLVFTSGYYYTKGDCIAGMECFGYSYGYGGSVTSVKLYDISDKENPVLEEEMEFEGYYLNSRLIGDTAYFIVNSNPRYPIYEAVRDDNSFDEEKNIIPLVRVNGQTERVAEAEEIGYVPNVMPTNFITIASLNLESRKMDKEVVTASGSTIYASLENLYITAPVWSRADELPVPMQIVGSIFVPNWVSVEKTSVSKFRLSDGEIDFIAEGVVPGSILNQFSMDEFDGHFRIATTVGQVSRSGSESKNNVYVLGEEMDVVGVLEDLAPGESIYSARFMGEKCYLVTFRKIDPLFVIDLSEHSNPKVLGKLKIPGYSDYLHPIDESHILGLGKETIEAAKGDFAWHQGIKMAIFDVSDPTNPIEMDKIVIGDRGTESYALHDHRAFLFSKERELLVIPVTLAEIPEEQKKIPGEEMFSPSYGEPVFQGAMVFNVSLDSGISERGRITHVTEEDELKRGYYYSGDYSVKRSFYIDEVLYTFSDRALKANGLSDLEEISKVDFDKADYGNYPYYE